jgi:hypothetical protein
VSAPKRTRAERMAMAVANAHDVGPTWAGDALSLGGGFPCGRDRKSCHDLKCKHGLYQPRGKK